MEIKGIGLTKAIQLKAAFNLGMRASKQVVTPKYRIEHPLHAYYLLKEELENEKRELFVVILQDVKGYVICHEVVSIGTLSQTLVHPREVFKVAMLSNASKIICFHNHPSGNLKCSKEDENITNRLKECGEILGIELVDHIIIGDNDTYFSFKENCMM